MKKFLKEAGGADLYGDLEVRWQRGHDPELEVGRCVDASGKVEQHWTQKMSLAPFTTEQLHYLMQCHGMTPKRGAAVPVAEPAAACDFLPKSEESSWSKWVIAAVLALLLMVLVRCCILPYACPGGVCGPRSKLKREDFSPISQEETELARAEVIGAQAA